MAPLDRQIVSVPFAKGLNTQPDAKQLGPGHLLAADNVVFESPNQVKKRNGYLSGLAGDAGDPTSGRAIVPLGDGVCVFGRYSVHSRTENCAQGNLPGWVNASPYDCATIKSSVPVAAISGVTDSLNGVDVAWDGTRSMGVLTWGDGAEIILTIVDATTKNTVRRLVLDYLTLTQGYVVTVWLARVYTSNTDPGFYYVLFSYTNATTATSRTDCYRVDATTGTTTSGNTSSVFKALWTSATTSARPVLVNGSTGGVIKVSSAPLSSTTFQTEYSFTSASYVANAPVAIARNTSTGRWHVFHNTGATPSDVIVTVSGTTWSQYAAATGISVVANEVYGACDLSTSVALVTRASATLGDAATPVCRRYTVTDVPVATLAGQFPYGAVPVSRPWADAADKVYVVMFNQAPFPFADFSLAYDSQLWAVL